MITAKTKPPAKAPKYAVPALDRGLDILEALSRSPLPQSLSELARTLNCTPSGLFRLLNRLERRAYVMRDEVSGKYSLTLKLFEVSHTHPVVEKLIVAAAGPMRELADTVQESVHLSMMSHGGLLVLLDIGSPLRVKLSHEVGSRFSVVGTNSGRLLLAYLSSEELADFLGRDQEFAAFTDEQKKAFHAELQAIRRNRYAASDSGELVGLKDIAVLAGNPAVGHTAALAIASLQRGRQKQDVVRLARDLQQCASKITLALGLSYDLHPIL